jgi:hypothetical protein
VAEDAKFWEIDENTVTLAADTYEYDLPNDFMYLFRVTMADADGDFYDPPIDPDQYNIVFGSTPKLHFKTMHPDRKFEDHVVGRLWRDTDLVADRKLRLEGLAAQATLSADTSTCAIDPNYIIYQAAATLFLSRARGTENDPDDNRTRGTICQQIANIERERIVKMQLPANSKRIRE